MKKLNGFVLCLGFVFLGYLVLRVGPQNLFKQVLDLGWGVVPLIMGEGLANLAHTVGWKHCLRRGSAAVPLPQLFRMAMSGYAINYLLPTASVGGEATRAALLASTRPASEAVSSVVLDKLSTGIAHLLLAVVGAGFLLCFSELTAAMWIAMAVTTALLALGMGLFLLIQYKGKLGSLLRWFAERNIGGGFAKRAAGKVSEVDHALRSFHAEQPVDFLVSILWHLVGHSVAILHAWLFLKFLGLPATLLEVACVGFISLWFDLVTFAVPLNLGALEGSRIVALRAIGNSASSGMAFGVSVRITQVFWAVVGILMYSLLTTSAFKSKRTSPVIPV